MKKVLSLIISLFCLLNATAVELPPEDGLDPGQVAAIYMEFLMTEIVPALYDKHDYAATVTRGEDFLSWYEPLSEGLKEDVQFRFYLYTCLAEAAAREGKYNDALGYIERAVDNGCDSFTYVLDVFSIPEMRDYPGFDQAIAPLREKNGDYIGLLRRDHDYRPDPDKGNQPSFTYSGPHYYPISKVLDYFDLETIAGDGDEVSQMVKVMDWVHNEIPHNGASWYPGEPNIIDIYHYSKATGNGVNCRMLATALNECYLALGFPSRVVSCLPADDDDMDCHIINAVWSDVLGK